MDNTRKSSLFISTRNFFGQAFGGIRKSELLNKILVSRNKKRFSTYLVTTFAALASLSVVLIVIALYGYFDKRVEAEFRKKILAEKGQIEILLKSRISDINKRLKDIGSDNVIRVTVMLDQKSQLAERVSEFYPSRQGVYFFVKKWGEPKVIPESYPDAPKSLIERALVRYPYGEFVKEGAETRLLWWLSTPIMHQSQLMGTAYALYDMTRDKKLTEQIQQTVNGDVALLNSGQLHSLVSGKAQPLDENLIKSNAAKLEFLNLGKTDILSKIGGFDNLYFKSSLEGLVSEKRKVNLWIGFSSIIILALSIIMSIQLGKRMVDPLRRMTKMAIKISEGQQNLSFDTGKISYWEFDQLSQAFNYMLATLSDAEEHSRYKELLENVEDAVYILNREGHVLEANEAAYARLGYSQEEFYELNVSDIIPHEQARAIMDQVGHEPQGDGPEKITIETTHAESNGNLIPVEIQSRAISYRGRNVILNVARDVTDRIETEKEKKQLESQLFHSQKMEAIGTLAGGIAHDFNNLLMGIQGYVSLMRLQSSEDDPNSEYMQGIEDAVMNAANLTNQLLGFARKGKYRLRPTSLNRIIENSTKMFIRTTKEIVTHLKLQEDIWSVEVDQGQFEQVLINIYLNARQAMPDGGDIFIQTENIYLSEAYCAPYEVPAGNYVKASVTDTGVGISADIIERIFEPFFTTKDVGQGTGLGLASAYGIVKNHNGIIRVYSELGNGTTFNIYLPASGDEVAHDIPVRSEVLKGEEKILLVDDEEGTIKVEKLMLKELGYSVLPAMSGREAVRLYKKNKSDLDLVALDMIMPEMNGKDTFEELKKINPEVKVLLVSGYSLNKQIEELMKQGCDGFIQKPFDIVQLSHKIREVLEN